jgi:hypothetical protein
VWFDSFVSAVMVSVVIVAVGAMAAYLGRRPSSWLDRPLARVGALGGTDQVAVAGLLLASLVVLMPLYLLLRLGEALVPADEEVPPRVRQTVGDAAAEVAAGARASGEPRPAPPGWYPDPIAVADYRWWSGTAWTEHTRTGSTLSAV